MCFLIYVFAIKWAWKAPICFSVIEFIAMFLQVPCIIALLFCDSFVRFTASRLLPLANANLFGGDGFSRIRGNGWWRPASAGKNAVSVRGTISGPPVNRSEARPGPVSHAPRQGRPGLSLQPDGVLVDSEALGAYCETVKGIRSKKLPLTAAPSALRLPLSRPP